MSTPSPRERVQRVEAPRCPRCGRYTSAFYDVWNKYTHSIDDEVCWDCLPSEDKARDVGGEEGGG